jgi:hypothetical protein
VYIRKPHKSFPREAGESGEVRKLKDAVRRLESDKRKLISELETLKAAFQRTTSFIESKFDKIPVEEVLSLIKQKKKKKELTPEPECGKCHSIEITFFDAPGKRIKYCLNCKHREIDVLNPQTQHPTEMEPVGE